MPEPEEAPVSVAEGRRILARVVRLFRPYRRGVLTVAGAILLSSGLGVLNPLLIRKIFDDALFVAGGPDMRLLWELIGAMVGVAVVASAIGVFQTYVAARIGQSVMRDLRQSLYERLKSMRFASSRTRGPARSSRGSRTTWPASTTS
jgi:ATP-binding cassette subfamily B protein